MTESLPYARPMPPAYSPDLSHLKTLAICHYVWGGLSMAISCIFIIHIVMGIVFLTNPQAMGASPPPTRTVTVSGGRTVVLPPTPQPAQQQPPAFLGWMFIGMGSTFLLLGWTTGILTIISGRKIARQRSRVFSLVVAGINCVNVPIGTTLGVFTFIVLLRPSVQAMYDSSRDVSLTG
jgi:hypothetical protein